MENTVITIDPKKNRIRFYRTLLKQLENPRYIQLLVDPNRKIIAVTECEKSSISAIKINGDIDKENCYEIHSQEFIYKLFELMKITDRQASYRLTGLLNEKDNVALFPLSNATKIKVEDNEDE